MAFVVEETGPKEWNLLELRLAKAIDVGKVKDPSIDLNGNRLPLLKIFQHDRWQVKPEELELLKPSIQLASNIVRVGLPYIASFLPPQDEMFDDGEFYDENGQRENLCPREIALKDNPSENEVAAALESLESLAPLIRWQTNNEIFALSGRARGEDSEALGWMGITRLVDEPRPWGIITDDMVVGADASSKTKDLAHRPLIIAIMGEYVKAIRNSPKGSEPRLRATFMAGITMVHEVGHAIFHQDFRSYNPPTLEEPYVGNDCSSELGISFIKWIFGGFHPNIAALKDHTLTDYAAHLNWTEHYSTDIERRPLYKTLYSISVPWIEEKLTQSWWDDLPSPKHLIDFSSKAKEALKPITDTSSNETATARLPEWLYSWMLGSAKWKYDFNFRKRGYRPGDKVEGLSEEEIAWAKANQALTKYDAVFASKSPEELKQAQRRARLMDPERKEDEEEEGFMRSLDDDLYDRFGGVPASKDDIVELDIEDGVLEKDIFPPKEKENTPLTRIVVRYLPGEDTSAKRPRDDDDEQGRPVKRAKVSTEVEGFLEKSSPFNLASEMTRMEIHNLCASRKIPGYTRVEPNEYWQQAHPNLDDGQEDLWVAVGLFNDMIDTALLHLFLDDIDARIKLKQASLDSVQEWGWPQLRRFCLSNGIDFRGAAGTAKVRDLVRDWKHAEIESLQAASVDQLQPLEFQTDDPSTNPENWTLHDLQDFCQQNDLPSTGTKTSMIIRTKRYKREQAKGVVHPRRPQRHRLDANGFEVYSFRAILGQSTVRSLKSALFIAGNFLPSAVLSLYFAGSIFQTLRDDQALLTYNTPTPDWTTLRLKVAPKRTEPGSSPATAIEVDDPRPKIKFSTPLPVPGTTLASAVSEPAFPVVTFGDELTPLEHAAAARADPKIQREAEVLIGGANPTFSELLTSIGNRASKLDQMMLAGGKFQQLGRASRSGLEILEEVEDYEEGEEQRKRALEALMKEPGMGEGEERDPVEGYPKAGSSHMADLFWAQNKKFSPREDEADEYEEGFGGV